MLAGLGERRLDHDVVERDRGGELGRAVGAQLVGHRVEAVEDLAKAGRQLRLDRLQAACHRAVADPADLLHEALEEDRVAGLVDLLGGEEVLLLLQRRGVDVGGEVVGDGVLAPEEQAVVPQRGLALELGELLAPLARVLGEVELRRAPVAALPARVEVLVGDRVGRQVLVHRPGGVRRWLEGVLRSPCGSLKLGMSWGSMPGPHTSARQPDQARSDNERYRNSDCSVK